MHEGRKRYKNKLETTKPVPSKYERRKKEETPPTFHFSQQRTWDTDDLLQPDPA